MSKKKPPTTMPIDRRVILGLAIETGMDPRTIKRALENGVSSLRAFVDQDRLREAAAKMGLKLE